MSTPVIPESDKQRRCRHASIVRTTDNMKADPWWWECDACEKQFVDRELLGTAESLVRELARALQGYRMEHSQQNCYYAGNVGQVCDECRAVDELLSRVPNGLEWRDEMHKGKQPHGGVDE